MCLWATAIPPRGTGLRYSAPYGHGRGRQTEGRAPSGASLPNGGYHDTNGSYQDKRDCIHGTSQDLIEAAAETDCLGWDSLLEGGISKQWLVGASPFLRMSNKFLLPPSWGRQLINKLHNIVHKQWMYRNTFIHYRGTDGLKLPEHHDIINRVEEHAFTDPESLVPRHRFLMETDFEALGSGPSTQRLLWLANVDSAIAASALAQSGSLTPEAIAHFNTVE
jgi:hypothetical protein